MEVWSRKSVTYSIMNFIKKNLLIKSSQLVLMAKLWFVSLMVIQKTRSVMSNWDWNLGDQSSSITNILLLVCLRQGKKSIDLGVKLLETVAENTQFEMEVPTMDTSSCEKTTT